MKWPPLVASGTWKRNHSCKWKEKHTVHTSMYTVHYIIISMCEYTTVVLLLLHASFHLSNLTIKQRWRSDSIFRTPTLIPWTKATYTSIGNYSLVACDITSGRTHQIRVHMLEKPSPGMKFWDVLMNFVLLFCWGWMSNITPNGYLIFTILLDVRLYTLLRMWRGFFFQNWQLWWFGPQEFDGLGPLLCWETGRIFWRWDR